MKPKKAYVPLKKKATLAIARMIWNSGVQDMDVLKRVICALIGHSKIVSTFWGEVYCGRCKDRIGDTLAHVYPMTDRVIIGHNCKKCRANYKLLTWQDKLYVPDPFKKQPK